MRLADRDMLHTLLNQLWRVAAGPVLLLCIPLFLTSVEQGYWYTFTSLAALAVFADLGFSTIVLQFAAHEFTHLSFDKNGEVCGDRQALFNAALLYFFEGCNSVARVQRICMVIAMANSGIVRYGAMG